MVKKQLNRSDILQYSRRVHRRRRLIKSLFWLGLILLALAEVFWFLHWDKLNFRTVIITGASPSLASKVEVITRDYLASDYFYFVPRSNVLFYPRRALEATLKSTLPEIAKLELARASGNQLLIKIDERVASYLWCQSEAAGCQLLDRDGFAFVSAPEYSGEPFFEFAGPLPEVFSRAAWLQEAFSELLPRSMLRLQPKRFSNTERGEWRWSFTQSETIFLVDSRQLPELTLKNLEATLASPAFSTEFRENEKLGRELEYLDLRFPDKVFYKFKSA